MNWLQLIWGMKLQNLSIGNKRWSRTRFTENHH